MEIDRRPAYVWLVVLFANLGTLLAIFLFNIVDRNPIFEIWNLVPLCISLVLTIVPVLISKTSSPIKNRFGYGIPAVSSLPLLYFIYDYYTCTGKLCQLGPFILGWGLFIAVSVFALFYAMGIYAAKWNIKFVVSLLGIEVVLLIGSALYFGYIS